MDKKNSFRINSDMNQTIRDDESTVSTKDETQTLCIWERSPPVQQHQSGQIKLNVWMPSDLGGQFVIHMHKDIPYGPKITFMNFNPIVHLNYDYLIKFSPSTLYKPIKVSPYNHHAITEFEQENSITTPDHDTAISITERYEPSIKNTLEPPIEINIETPNLYHDQNPSQYNNNIINDNHHHPIYLSNIRNIETYPENLVSLSSSILYTVPSNVSINNNNYNNNISKISSGSNDSLVKISQMECLLNHLASNEMYLGPDYLKFTTNKVGMSNIAHWLKSLRLHKYVGIFDNITYEQMMHIDEKYLQSLGVTKGASHKLAMCVEKLHERFANLIKLEKDLLLGKIQISWVLEELSNVVLTPMKPINKLNKDNIAAQILKLIDLVSQMVTKKPVDTTQEEECLNAVLWLIEICIHSEAFATNTNKLKNHKFKLIKMKIQLISSNSRHDKHKCGSNENNKNFIFNVRTHRKIY